MFVQWQDTITFHASLFRCFLVGNELAVFSQSSEILLAVIAAVTGQTPLSRPNDAMTQCPPQWRRGAPSLTSFVIMPTHPPAVLHGLVPHNAYDIHSHLGSDLPGRAQVPLLNDVLFMGVVAWFFLWLITLVIAMWRSSSAARAQSTSNPIIPRPFPVAVDAATNAGKGGQPLPRDQNGTRQLIMGVPEDVDIRASMPGAWRHECRMQNALEISTDMTSWRFVLNYSQRLFSITLFFAPSGALMCNPINETTVENGDSLMCQGLDVDNVIPASDAKSGPSDLNPHESATRCEPPTISDVAIEDLDAPREDRIGPTFIQAPSVDAIRPLCQDLDGDDSTSEDRTNGTEDQDLISIDKQCPSVSTSYRKEDYHVLGRRQDGALSDTGYPLPEPHRRSYSAGGKHNIFDEDVSDDDSYWTEQVNSRLSSPRVWRHGSDVALWPREGRADESDNWRLRHGEVTRVAPSEKATRRHSSPHVNATETLSGHASGDDDPGIYVVPQRRHGRFGSSSPCALEGPTGLGFFPLRRTPSLLTPEAWRAGCLYTPDAPADEASQAEVWWDNLSLNSVGGQPGVSRDRQPSWRDRYENDPTSRRFYATHQRAMTEG